MPGVIGAVGAQLVGERDRREERRREACRGEGAERHLAIAAEWCAACTGGERGETERDAVECVWWGESGHVRNLGFSQRGGYIEQPYDSTRDIP